MKPCPYCAELIQDQAAKCRYCGEWLDPSRRPAWSQEAKAAARATAPAGTGLDPLVDDDGPEGTGATLPVGSGVPSLGRREPEPPRSWSAPAWLANAQAARGEPREDPSTDRSTLEEVALRMERIRQSAAAVREGVEPSPRAVRPAERATLEVEPGVTLPAGSLRAVGLDPHEPSRRKRGREPARAVASAPRAAAPMYDDEDDELADFEDDAAPPRPRTRAERDELVLRSERPTVPDIPRSQLLGEPAPARRRRDPHAARAERPSRRVSDELLDEPYDEPELAPERAVRRKRSLPPEAELGGPPTERAILERRADDDDERRPSSRKLAAPPPAPVFDDDEDELDDDDLPPPRAGADAPFDDDFLDDDDGDEGDDDGYDDFAAAGPAPRPLPWRPILIAAGVIVVAGVLLFRDYLFPGEPATDEVAAEADADAEADAASAPAPAPKVEGQGQPVQPDANADAGAVVADAAQPAAPAQPAALDPATSAMLDEARKAYAAADGNVRKLQPVGAKLEEVLAKAPDDPDALTLMAQVYLEQGKMDDSLATSSRCTEVSPGTAACWLTIGVIQETKGAGDVAKLAYQKYLDLAPEGRYANDARKAIDRLK